jgi:hypothetical protein
MDLSSILYQALSSPYGLVLRCNKPAQGRTAISVAKAKLMDPSLSVLECRLSPLDPNELWLIRKDAKLGDSDAQT